MLKASILAVALLAPAFAQKLDPVQWTLSVEPAEAGAGSEVLGRLTAKIDEGWHLYSLTTPKPPIATTITLAPNDAIESIRVYQPPPIRKVDPYFSSETQTFEKEVVFLIALTLKPVTSASLEMVAQLRYQACSEKLCLPPRKKTATATLSIDSSPKVTAAIPPGYTEFRKVAATAVAPAPAKKQPEDLASYLLVAFGFGLAAIFTPCVFPMIPITMSFFLNREAATRRESVTQAALFCLGIIVLFTSLGFLMKAIAGPVGVVKLAASPWVNSFISLVFLVFGLSLLGAFELTLPSGLLTKLDRASQGGGYVGTLIMGLTFSLTSFACVGPIVGPLLVASVQTEGLKPVLGMLSFATGLAAPFFLLALFPSFLKKLPRSGGWMVRVKVVLGFIVLAVMFKYLSNIDAVLQTSFLTRERFLAAWIVLFALPGLYLLGFLRLEGVRPEDSLGVGRALTGAALLIFSVSLVPGMFGAPLGDLDAYVPAAAASASATSGPLWLKNQYAEALAQAKQENKLVLINFTGYACTNCHWMKANMFTRPEIAGALKDLVLLDLFTDGEDQASEQNQKLEEQKFGTVAIPYYALLDANERVIATFPGLTKNPQEFLAFLKSRS